VEGTQRLCGATLDAALAAPASHAETRTRRHHPWSHSVAPGVPLHSVLAVELRLQYASQAGLRCKRW